MTRTFIQTNEFSRNWDELGFDDEHMRKLELELLKNPQSGSVIRGTGRLRKMRFSNLTQAECNEIKKMIQLLEVSLEQEENS